MTDLTAEINESLWNFPERFEDLDKIGKDQISDNAFQYSASKEIGQAENIYNVQEISRQDGGSGINQAKIIPNELARFEHSASEDIYKTQDVGSGLQNSTSEEIGQANRNGLGRVEYSASEEIGNAQIVGSIKSLTSIKDDQAIYNGHEDSVAEETGRKLKVLTSGENSQAIYSGLEVSALDEIGKSKKVDSRHKGITPEVSGQVMIIHKELQRLEDSPSEEIGKTQNVGSKLNYPMSEEIDKAKVIHSELWRLEASASEENGQVEINQNGLQKLEDSTSEEAGKTENFSNSFKDSKSEENGSLKESALKKISRCETVDRIFECSISEEIARTEPFDRGLEYNWRKESSQVCNNNITREPKIEPEKNTSCEPDLEKICLVQKLQFSKIVTEKESRILELYMIKDSLKYKIISSEKRIRQVSLILFELTKTVNTWLKNKRMDVCYCEKIITKLIAEKNQLLKDYNTLENSCNSLVLRFEKSKVLLQNYQQNAELLRQSSLVSQKKIFQQAEIINSLLNRTDDKIH